MEELNFRPALRESLTQWMEGEECSTWLRFLESLYPGNSQEDLVERKRLEILMAFCTTLPARFSDWIIYLSGGCPSGKGVIGQWIMNLIGGGFPGAEHDKKYHSDLSQPVLAFPFRPGPWRWFKWLKKYHYQGLIWLEGYPDERPPFQKLEEFCERKVIIHQLKQGAYGREDCSLKEKLSRETQGWIQYLSPLRSSIQYLIQMSYDYQQGKVSPEEFLERFEKLRNLGSQNQ